MRKLVGTVYAGIALFILYKDVRGLMTMGEYALSESGIWGIIGIVLHLFLLGGLGILAFLGWKKYPNDMSTHTQIAFYIPITVLVLGVLAILLPVWIINGQISF